MTKVRPPLSVENALWTILGALGADRAAHVVGRNADYLRSLSDPDNRYTLGVEHAIQLDLAYLANGGEGAPIYEAYGLILEAQRAERFACQFKLATATAVAIREGGQACAALVSATLPDATDADRATALREVEEAITAMTRCAPLVQALLAREKPP